MNRAKAIAAAMLASYDMKPNTKRCGRVGARQYLNHSLFGRAKAGDFEGMTSDEHYGIVTALYGIDHALSTGRVSGQVEAKVRDLSAWRFLQMVARISLDCETMGEVPAWLNRELAA